MAKKYETAESRICVICGNEFRFHNARLRRGDAGRYCSIACRDFGKIIIKKCLTCGKEFGANKRYEGTWKEKKYCSPECYGKNMRKDRVARECQHCGKEFQVLISTLKTKPQYYCSQSCALKSKKPTQIEIIGNGYLKSLGIEYVEQHKIGKYWIDAFLPESKLAVEWDGRYWHSIPRAIARDRIKDKYLNSEGIRVLRIDEFEVKNNPSLVKEKILSAIA